MDWEVSSAAHLNSYDYDHLGRVTKQRNYDPNDVAGADNPLVEQSWIHDVLDPSDEEDFVRTEYSQYTTTDGTSFNLVGETTYFTDRLGRFAKLIDDEQTASGITDKTVDFNYDAADQLQSITRSADAGGFQFDTQYEYDHAGRVTNISHFRPLAPNPQTPFTSYDYQYDLAHRITEQTTSVDTSIAALSTLSSTNVDRFTFDDAGQLIDDSTEIFTYDDNGNRDDGTIAIDDHNRLTEDADYTYTYDSEGNVTRRDSKTSSAYTQYTRDHRNRLTTVVNHDASGDITGDVIYHYNADDQVANREQGYYSSGQLTGRDDRHYVYDGNQRVLETAEEDDVTRRYMWGPGIDQLIVDEAFYSEGNRFSWAANDHLGSVGQLLDIDNDVVEHREFDSFGAITAVFDELGNSETPAFMFSQVTHAGSIWDDEAGLYQKGQRFYDPATGRFLSEDSIGFGDGPNPYRYAGNDPVNFRDPTGLSQAGNPLNNLFGTNGGYSGGIIAPAPPPIYTSPTVFNAFSAPTGFNFSIDSVSPGNQSFGSGLINFSSNSLVTQTAGIGFSGPGAISRVSSTVDSTFPSLFPESNVLNNPFNFTTAERVTSLGVQNYLNNQATSASRSVFTNELNAFTRDSSIRQQIATQPDPFRVLDQTLSNPRVQGGLRVAQGAGEFFVAAGLAIAPEPTLATKAGSFVVAAHAADQLATGFNELVFGVPQQSVAAQLSRQAVTAIGLPSQANSAAFLADVGPAPLVAPAVGTQRAGIQILPGNTAQGSFITTQIDVLAENSVYSQIDVLPNRQIVSQFDTFSLPLSTPPQVPTVPWRAGRYIQSASRPNAYWKSGQRVFPTLRNSGLRGQSLRAEQEAFTLQKLQNNHPVGTVYGQAGEAGLTVLGRNEGLAHRGAAAAVNRAIQTYNLSLSR